MLIDKEEIFLNKNQVSVLKKGREKKILEETGLYKIKYLVGKVEVDGYFAIPNNYNERLPVIIWNRGGYREKGKLDDFTAYITLGEIAHWGYCVLASQYRKNDEFSSEDIISLINIAGEIPFVDNYNLAMEGWSRGGFMTYYCLKDDIKVKCAVIVAGLADIDDYCQYNKKMKLISDVFCNKRRGQLKSPVKFCNLIQKVPILFIHGTNDKEIPYEQSVNMYNLLKENNPEITYELELIEGGSHTLKENRNYVSYIRRLWYEKYLKNVN